jgi:hypothetical protein
VHVFRHEYILYWGLEGRVLTMCCLELTPHDGLFTSVHWACMYSIHAWIYPVLVFGRTCPYHMLCCWSLDKIVTKCLTLESEKSTPSGTVFPSAVGFREYSVFRCVLFCIQTLHKHLVIDNIYDLINALVSAFPIFISVHTATTHGWPWQLYSSIGLLTGSLNWISNSV